MRDPQNPYKDAYSFNAREYDRAYERRVAEQKAQADASTALLIKSLSAPAPIVRRAPPHPALQQSWPAIGFSAECKEKGSPWRAVSWIGAIILLAGVVLVI